MSQLRILVVDDDPAVRDVLQEALLQDEQASPLPRMGPRRFRP